MIFSNIFLKVKAHILDSVLCSSRFNLLFIEFGPGKKFGRKFSHFDGNLSLRLCPWAIRNCVGAFPQFWGQMVHFWLKLLIFGVFFVFLQALNGFLLILTCDGEVFFATHSIESYLGFHQVKIRKFFKYFIQIYVFMTVAMN
jgi:hypothetical protein